MEFDLSETQQLFKRSARELFSQECPPNLVREMIEGGQPYSEKLWNKLAEQGWTGLIFSEEDGGQGLGMVEMAVAFEEMGYSLVPGAFLWTVTVAGSLIARTGNADQRKKYLHAIIEGRAKAAVAVLEESGDWSPDSISLSAAESGDGLKLQGRKLFVNDAGIADFIIVSAIGGNGPIIAVVERNAPGLNIRPMPSLDGTRDLFEVTFEDTVVPVGNILARGRESRQALEHALDVGTLALCAEMVGGMQWIMDASVEYAKTRKQFGKPIGQFQAVQHHCADMLLQTESTRSAVYYAAWVMESEPGQAPLAVSIAKAYASDSFRDVGNRGIQVHGGLGFTWDENVHFYYKRAKAAELMFGDAAFHRERIASLLID